MSARVKWKWRRATDEPIPEGDSVLCWDAVNEVMFTGYRYGDGLFQEPRGEAVEYVADWWTTLPEPP